MNEMAVLVLVVSGIMTAVFFGVRRWRANQNKLWFTLAVYDHGEKRDIRTFYGTLISAHEQFAKAVQQAQHNFSPDAIFVAWHGNGSYFMTLPEVNEDPDGHWYRLRFTPTGREGLGIREEKVRATDDAHAHRLLATRRDFWNSYAEGYAIRIPTEHQCAV